MSLSEILESLTEYDTSLIAETIGYIDPTPDYEMYMGGSIQCLTPAAGVTVGVAVTIEVDSSTPGHDWDFEPLFDLFDPMEKMKVPTVLVMKTYGSRPDHECCMGDGVAKALVAIGCVGMVTDGRVRDLEGVIGMPFGVYAKGRTVDHTAWQFRNPQKPIEIGGITINPGDVIHANIQGVLKIPSACLQQLPERAAAMLAFEHRAHAIYRQRGIPINVKRKMVTNLLPEFGFKTPPWTQIKKPAK